VVPLTYLGTGGGAKLEFIFHDAADKTFRGLDFGTCIVGLQYEKSFSIKNIGTVDAVINLTHPSSCLTFVMPRNESGEIRISPFKQIDGHATLKPTQPDIVRDPITIDMGASKVQTIALKAKCGAYSWNCTGELDFLNMPIGESQSKVVVVQNTGTLEIPFEISLEPESMTKYVNFLSMENNWVKGRQLRPEQTISFEVFVSGDQAMVVEGKVIMTTKLSGVTKTHTFPFKCRIYVQAVALDNVADVGIGRVMIGESVTYSCMDI
jgi:hypothetical protein